VTSTTDPPIEQLSLAFNAVGELIGGVSEEQWSAPTPCREWTVREVVNHLIGMNLVFTALMSDQAAPERGVDRAGDDPLGSYRDSVSVLLTAFDEPGVLERTFQGPLGSATGLDRLHIRLYDLLAHGWDVAHATGQVLAVAPHVVEQSLAFARVQLASQSRAGRFDPPQPVSDDAPAIDRLAAFLGRSITKA
jgi:uncharacterized protein (TIGR03086 family)